MNACSFVNTSSILFCALMISGCSMESAKSEILHTRPSMEQAESTETNSETNPETNIQTKAQTKAQKLETIIQTAIQASTNQSENSDSTSQWCYDEQLSEFQASSDEIDMLDLINTYRRTMNLEIPELSLVPEVSLVARLHSQEMANAEVAFGHDGFEERIAILAEILDFAVAAENVGYTQSRFRPLDSTFESWLESPSHLDNIEGDFEWTGIGIHSEQWIDEEGKTNNEFYVTQIFLY